MGARANKNKQRKKMYRAHGMIAANIKLLRQINGYTQEMLAEALHISRASYFNLENDCRLIDMESLYMISELYNINVDYLVSFDMLGQLMSIMRDEKGNLDSEVFIQKYFKLSHAGKEEIRQQVTKLKAEEANYNNFPWKYNC